MYIEPNSTIKLLRGIPLDNTYKDTLYFKNFQEGQLTYFNSKVKHTFTEQSYQRVNREIMRLAVPADKCYDCNYMMFQNTSYNGKWFFAFINKVEYKNNGCCEIYYEIDVMQTWIYDVSFRECFIERCHPSTDTLGSNINPEPVQLGEYTYANYNAVSKTSNDLVVIIAIVDTDGEAVDGELYDRVYGGCELWVYDSTDVQGINNKIKDYIKSPESIVSMYMAPKYMINGGTIPSTHKLGYGAGATAQDVSFDAITHYDDFDGYKPKWNKLYTYPYNYFQLDNANGSTLALRYEFFENKKPIISLMGNLQQPVKVVARPKYYKANFSTTDARLNTEQIVIEGYPMCSWNTDAFKAWLAQNTVPIAIGAVAGAATIAVTGGAGAAIAAGTLSANLAKAKNEGDTISAQNQYDATTMRRRAGEIGNTIGAAAGLAQTAYTNSIAADMIRGSIDSANVNIANGCQRLFSCRAHITGQYAKVIDDFFNMYGYAQNIVSKPDINAHPYWDYMKTSNCKLVGFVPADDLVRMEQINNSGITYWHDGDWVGKYSEYNNNNTPALG